MTLDIHLDLRHQDSERIAEAFAALGWNKPVEQYERYLAEQAAGLRAVLVADVDGSFAGYVTIVWRSAYPPFREHGVPEIQDLNVLPAFRRRGIGTALMDGAEVLARERSSVVGIGVGMDPDYGPAQAMYVLRGYVPDARGLASHGRHVAWGDTAKVDDDLVLYFTKELPSSITRWSGPAGATPKLQALTATDSSKEMDDPTEHSNSSARAQWGEKAAFWDRLHGREGNGFHRSIVEPTVRRLLELMPGERVVDAACGNGTMARRLAIWGAHVTAFDFSAELVELARAHGSADEVAIDYRVIDATDETAVVGLGEGSFDAAVCTMALMDMPVVAPLYRAIHRLLRPGGRFVFVTGHPVFDTANPVRLTEQRDAAGELTRRHALRIEQYLDVPPTRAVGARGEPTPHDFHHRPLSELLGEAFAAGFVLEAIEEPSFPASKDEFWQFPPALAGRLRKLREEGGS